MIPTTIKTIILSGKGRLSISQIMTYYMILDICYQFMYLFYLCFIWRFKNIWSMLLKWIIGMVIELNLFYNVIYMCNIFIKTIFAIL